VGLGEDQDWIRSYRDAYQLLQERAADAEVAFAELLRLRPDDALARLHLTRLRNGERGATLVLEGK
jgi:hypothetical protein